MGLGEQGMMVLVLASAMRMYLLTGLEAEEMTGLVLASVAVNQTLVGLMMDLVVALVMMKQMTMVLEPSRRLGTIGKTGMALEMFKKTWIGYNRV